MTDDRGYFVLARKKGSEENYQLVSYNRKLRTHVHIDVGPTKQNAQQFAMTEEDTREAVQKLQERDYETVVFEHHHFPFSKSDKKTGINLDWIVSEEEMRAFIQKNHPEAIQSS